MDRESETDGLTGRQMASDRDRLDRVRMVETD